MTLRLTTLFAAAAVSALALAACTPKAAAPAAADTSAITDALKAQTASYAADVNAKHVDKVSDYYASDAVVMQPNLAAAEGAPAIAAQNKAAMADPAFHLTLTVDSVSVASSGDWASITGHAVTTATDPKSHKAGDQAANYLVTEKKDASGAWKVEAVAVVNTAAAPAPAAAPAASAPAPVAAGNSAGK